MNVENVQDQNLSFIRMVTLWIMQQDRRCLLDTYANIYRYVAFCHSTGKLSVSIKDGQPAAVVFHWADWKERIEAKAENNHQQFDFSKAHPGDSLFIGEVLGDRASIGEIYNAHIQRHPLLAAVPYYTYRDGKLIRLNARVMERFMKLKGGSIGKFRA